MEDVPNLVKALPSPPDDTLNSAKALLRPTADIMNVTEALSNPTEYVLNLAEVFTEAERGCSKFNESFAEPFVFEIQFQFPYMSSIGCLFWIKK